MDHSLGKNHSLFGLIYSDKTLAKIAQTTEIRGKTLIRAVKTSLACCRIEIFFPAALL